MASLICGPHAGFLPATTTNLFHWKAWSSATTDFDTLVEGGSVLAKVK